MSTKEPLPAAADHAPPTAITAPGLTSDTRPVVTRADVEEWTGQRLTDEQIQQLRAAIRHSIIPDAIRTIVSCTVDRDAALAPIDTQAPVVNLVARYRALAAQETSLYHSYPGTLEQVDAAVLPYEHARHHIRDLLIARGHAELAAALLHERDSRGVIHDEIAAGRADDVPDIYRDRAARAAQTVNRLTAEANQPEMG